MFLSLSLLGYDVPAAPGSRLPALAPRGPPRPQAPEHPGHQRRADKAGWLWPGSHLQLSDGAHVRGELSRLQMKKCFCLSVEIRTLFENRLFFFSFNCIFDEVLWCWLLITSYQYSVQHWTRCPLYSHLRATSCSFKTHSENSWMLKKWWLLLFLNTVFNAECFCLCVNLFSRSSRS